MFYTERITKPLVQLTDAANQADKGNYEYELTYDKDDELGRLTNTFKRMSQHMKDHISDLNKQVFVDALTHVKNKGAFSSYIDNLQQQMNKDREKLIFAIGIFDCNDLKSINDQFGHSSGDTYIKTASRTICRTFQHSPVFRIGGDEFSVILENEDYQNREELAGLFDRYCVEVNESTSNRWEQVHVAMGIAAYDPDIDTSVNDVIHRADKLMYDNKKQNKQLKTKA
jgi:diguanylate cyclase (GGDEF)-like protein